MLALLAVLLCISGTRSQCVNIVRYPARNMTATSCPINAFTCTSVDVMVDTVEATVIGGQYCQCVPGSCQSSYVDVYFVIYVEAIAATRYDVTVYLSNDGQTLAPPVSTSCLGWAAQPGEGIGYYTAPYCSHWGNFTNEDGDGCGDIRRVQSPVFANITARVSCANVNSNGTLVVPAMITWDQNSGSTCSLAAFGGTGSKCQSENVTFTHLLPPCQVTACPPNDQCSNYTCNEINGTAHCNRTIAVGKTCIDSLYCTTASVCDSVGDCVGSAFVSCGASPNPCQLLSCQEIVNGSVCAASPLPNGTSCSTGNVCKFGGTCQLGACVETSVSCPANTTCAEYACLDPGGCTIFPRTGIACGPSDVCQSHTCNSLGLCVDTYAPSSQLCGAGETSCQYSSHCDGIGNCAVGDLKPNGTLCSNCTGCLQAAYCTGVSPVCPVAVVLPCPSINCSVGSCLTDGECGCSYLVQDCHDTNACTQDFCNVSTGECYHPLIECPPIGTPPNQCIEYSCNSEDEEFPCVATPRNGQRCEIDTNQCLYGVCVTGYNSTFCTANPFDPIPLPPPVSQCCFYQCDPELGIFPVCNTSSPCNTDNMCYNYECTFNVNTTQCGCSLISEKPHPADTDCTVYVCNPLVGWTPEYQDGLPCGSPLSTVCDLPDTCQTGACHANYLPSSTVCVGETMCKYAANCTGTGLCSVQLDKPDGLSCSPAVGECDPGHNCLGGDCVPNYIPNGTLCGSFSECHSQDVCNGLGACVQGPALPDGTSCGVAAACGSRNCSSGICVNILLSGNICNESSSACQLNALCSGDNFFCPDRFPVAEGTLCRFGSGCTPSGYCDGQNVTCPIASPIVCNDGNACTLDSCAFNSSSGQSTCVYQNLSCHDPSLCVEYSCDPLLGCTGASVQCNDNNTCTIATCVNGSGCQFTPVAAETICDDLDPCTVHDVCGPTANCTGQPLCQPQQCGSVECVAGNCVYSPANQSANCTPTVHQSCPGDFKPCLAGFTCQGLECLPVYHPSTTVCRAAADECDLPDYCSGSSACCPLDLKVTNGQLCGDGARPCGAEQCQSGICTAVDLNTGQVCDASTNACEASALCQPGQFDCPAKQTVVPCCLSSGECGSLEACEDNLCVIQPQGCELSGCFDNVECMLSSCNLSSYECEYQLDDAYCQEEDFCMTYSCSPVILCLTGVNVGQLCSDDANCSRAAWVYQYWDCSLNSIEYPSLLFCQIACGFGVCTEHNVPNAAINGSCGTVIQSGCLATPIAGCCHEDLDCFDENLTDCNLQRCVNNSCESYDEVPPACCLSDSECPEASGCSYYNCTSNTCVLTEVSCPTPSSVAPVPSSPATTTDTVIIVPVTTLGDTLLFLLPLFCCLCGLIFLRRRHNHHHHHIQRYPARVQSRAPRRYV